MSALRGSVFRRSTAVAALTLSLAALGVGVESSYAATSQGSQASVSAAPNHEGRLPSASAVRFHDQMRELWDDHITYTRLAIVSFAANLPDLSATEARLLQNQTDLGNAIKPYYGVQDGDQFTALLRTHILDAVNVLVAAKAGDQATLTPALNAWYANANQIADFLHGLNPHHWGDAELRAMMKEHLDITLKEASDRLQGHYTQDIADFDQIHTQIIGMADMISNGIIRQFHGRF